MMRAAVPALAIAGTFAIGLAGCASVATTAVPAALAPTANESLVMTLAAKGVQVYECRARNEGGYEWAFVAPEAALFDRQGGRFGEHGAGPYWQASDGSKVVGTVKARADAPGAGAIPWLLLGTHSAGRDGSISQVTSIQRVNTTGGLPPSAGCGSDTQNAVARIAYTADYRLFTRIDHIADYRFFNVR